MVNYTSFFTLYHITTAADKHHQIKITISFFDCDLSARNYTCKVNVGEEAMIIQCIFFLSSVLLPFLDYWIAAVCLWLRNAAF
jgi:hypothetical protein